MSEPDNRGSMDKSTYLVGGRRFSPNDAGFETALEQAREDRERPRCLCVEGGVEMYTARLEHGCVLKRMPGSGNRHAAGCTSYEPPVEMSGLGMVMGSAITPDPIHGGSILRLGFPLSRRHREASGSVRDEWRADDHAPGRRLSMQALLHYLWDQAELNRWRPSFRGRRSWATVRRRLLDAAAEMRVGGISLASLLYIPEPFRVDEWPAIQQRRSQFFGTASRHGSKLLLILAELKELMPVRGRHQVTLKHMPDLALSMSDELRSRAQRRFQRELDLWASDPSSRLIVLATIDLNPASRPVISGMSVAIVEAHWLPLSGAHDTELVAGLIRSGRSFIKLLHRAPPAPSTTPPPAAALLTDTGVHAVPLFVSPGEFDPSSHPAPRTSSNPCWEWWPQIEAMPELPEVEREA